MSTSPLTITAIEYLSSFDLKITRVPSLSTGAGLDEVGLGRCEVGNDGISVGEDMLI